MIDKKYVITEWIWEEIKKANPNADRDDFVIMSSKPPNITLEDIRELMGYPGEGQ